MCRSGRHVRLCTCDAGNIDRDSFWRLYRSAEIEHLSVVGSFFPAEPTVQDQLIEEKICCDLNSFECFDFEYTPGDGDRLLVSVSGQNFWFIYSDGTRHDEASRWTISGPQFGVSFPDEPQFEGAVATERHGY